MEVTKVDRKEELDKEIESEKGTMISVGIVGAVIFITYLVLYGLYMVRV